MGFEAFPASINWDYFRSWFPRGQTYLVTLFTGIIMKYLLLFLVALSLSITSNATICKWADVPPIIDGKDDDAVWKVAEHVGDFQRAWVENPDQRKPLTETDAKICWDRESLYFFARMEDGDLFATHTEQDGNLWEDDVFELFFKPSQDFHGYYEFEFNAQNAVLDFYFPRRGGGTVPRFRKDFKFHIETAVKLDGSLNKWTDHDKGWTVEGKILWKDFIRAGGRPRAGDTWSYAACRYDYSVDFEGPNLSSNAPLKKLSFHRYEDFLPLTFEGPQTSYIPITDLKVKGAPGKPAPFKLERAYPELEGLKMPISTVAVPGSSQMLAITQDYAYGPTSVVTFEDREDVEELKVLMKLKGTAYDFAFHPDFENNGYLFLGWNDGKRTIVSRFNFDAESMTFNEDSETEFLTWEGNGHNGAAIDFGPDGFLYVTTGDGSTDSDVLLNGQRTNVLHAKLLRIDVNQTSEKKPYSIPADNPFVDNPDFAPETYAYGFRNPWRIDVDEVTGQIWVGNNGQDLWEQVYFVEKGANYGWSVVEGSRPFYPNREAGPTPISKPALEHSHAESRSLTGGLVYHGEALPMLKGHYVYGDYSTGKIWATIHDGEELLGPIELVDTPLNITDFNLDSQGELLVLDHGDRTGGGFYRLVPVADEQEENDFPKTLSETGLFSDVSKHELAPGVLPYSVNSERWADGAIQKRALAIPAYPNDEGKHVPERIQFNMNRAWIMPEGTVLIKTLSFPSGNKQRLVETQMLTLQNGDWAAYVYKWNAEGTDATLVEEGGEDVLLEDLGEGKAWRYASRAECMFCHSRAGGFALGMDTLQINRNHDYKDPHWPRNQLAAWDHIGLFSDNWVNAIRTELEEDIQKQAHGEDLVDPKKVKAKAKREVRELFGGARAYKHPLSDRLAISPESSKYSKQVAPFDESKPLNDRAWSYLQTNCANCHIGAGGGNAAINLAIGFPDEKRELVNVKPKHLHFNLPNARLVSPGKPGSSVLLHRIGLTGVGKMPIIGRNTVDHKGLELIREWIASMPPSKPERSGKSSYPRFR